MCNRKKGHLIACTIINKEINYLILESLENINKSFYGTSIILRTYQDFLEMQKKEPSDFHVSSIDEILKYGNIRLIKNKLY